MNKLTTDFVSCEFLIIVAGRHWKITYENAGIAWKIIINRPHTNESWVLGMNPRLPTPETAIDDLEKFIDQQIKKQ